MNRIIRYEGAIVQDEQILLIRQRQHDTGNSYWLFPGGGIEEGESEAECVEREMWEETNLRVAADRLLMDEPDHPGGVYKRRRTFLCSVISGTAAPGYEPEEDAAAAYGIVEVGWFDLRDESAWPLLAKEDGITYPQLRGVQQALGYL